MAEKKQKTPSQIALKKGGEYQEEFLQRFNLWATRWNKTCSSPTELAQALDLRSDDGLFAVLIETFPDLGTIASKTRNQARKAKVATIDALVEAGTTVGGWHMERKQREAKQSWLRKIIRGIGRIV